MRGWSDGGFSGFGGLSVVFFGGCRFRFVFLGRRLFSAGAGLCSAGAEGGIGEGIGGGSSGRSDTVRRLQLMSGLSCSNQGIPRIIVCIPIGATRKVRVWGTPTRVVLRVTCRCECVRIVPFARETRVGGQGSVCS